MHIKIKKTFQLLLINTALPYLNASKYQIWQKLIKFEIIFKKVQSSLWFQYFRDIRIDTTMK